jgi:hypothetical protein
LFDDQSSFTREVSADTLMPRTAAGAVVSSAARAAGSPTAIVATARPETVRERAVTAKAARRDGTEGMEEFPLVWREEPRQNAGG